MDEVITTSQANERVPTSAAGQPVLGLKTTWRDSTSHPVMSPPDFVPRRIEFVGPASTVGRLQPVESTPTSSSSPRRVGHSAGRTRARGRVCLKFTLLNPGAALEGAPGLAALLADVRTAARAPAAGGAT